MRHHPQTTRQVTDDVIALPGAGEGQAEAAGLTPAHVLPGGRFATDGDSSVLVRHAGSAQL